jgi:3-phenylpropionate/cinnamic acid dioxygenase small subunit
VGIYSEISQLLYRYCYAHDDRDIEGLRVCFAKDITIDGRAATFRGLRGRDEILAGYAKDYGDEVPRQRHLVTNILITNEAPDEVKVRSYYAVYRIHADGSGSYFQLTINCIDTIIKEDGDWKILHRVSRMDKAPAR